MSQPTVDAQPAASGDVAPATGQPAEAITTLPAQPTAPPTLAPLSAKTGEPVRPWTVWASTAMFLGAVVSAMVGLALVMWDLASPFVKVEDGYVKQDRFATASWLSGQWVTEPGSGWRVLIAVGATLIAFLVAATSAVVGFYAFRGYRWTAIGGVVAAATSLLTLTLNRPAWLAMGFAVLGAAPLWLPATGRFFARWYQLRHPEQVFSEPVDQVFYGPLPRYR